jgi:uncharacterized protein
MSEPKQVFSGISISDRNLMGFSKTSILSRPLPLLRKFWKILLFSTVCCLCGCLSHVLYHPSHELRATPADIGLPFESLFLQTANGTRLAAWWIPSQSPRGTLLFFHGNGGNISDRLDSIQIFNGLGLNLLIFDYRGYGKSTGSPSEEGIYRDAETAWNYLESIRGIDRQEIVVFGRSLGGSVAAWMSQEQRPGALILEDAFTSLQEAARDHIPGLFVKLFVPDQYPTIRYLTLVQCPVLVIHSRDDEVIPFRHGEALFEAAKGAKEFVVIRGSHNRGFLDSKTHYVEAVDTFLSKVLGQKKEK